MGAYQPKLYNLVIAKYSRMSTENLFRQIGEMIAGKQFEALQSLKIEKPKKFNWVTEVFENIHAFFIGR